MKPIQVERLSISFKQSLFREVSFEVGANEFVTIMGENGAGKTTLVDCLLGRITPKSGVIRYFGKSTENFPWDDLNAKVGWVLSDWETFPAYLDIEHFLTALRELYSHWDSTLERHLMSVFKLKPNHQLNQLSLGERAKLKLVRALSIRPSLLILDELTSNLSPASREEVTHTLIDLIADKKIAVLYFCHDRDEAMRLSTRVYELNQDGLVLTKESGL